MSNDVDCQTCTKQLKAVRGCERPLEKEGTLPRTAIKFKTCPRRALDHKMSFVLEAFHMFKQGHLPNPGTWQDQPNLFSQIMDEVEHYSKKFVVIEEKVK